MVTESLSLCNALLISNVITVSNALRRTFFFGLNQNAELEKGAKYQLLSLVF